MADNAPAKEAIDAVNVFPAVRIKLPANVDIEPDRGTLVSLAVVPANDAIPAIKTFVVDRTTLPENVAIPAANAFPGVNGRAPANDAIDAENDWTNVGAAATDDPNGNGLLGNLSIYKSSGTMAVLN